MRFWIATIIFMVAANASIQAQDPELAPSEPALTRQEEEQQQQEEQAIVELRALGGFVSTLSDQKVYKVSMRGRKFTDAHLNLLRSFPTASDLDLTGSRVTDAGLEQLTKFPNLKSISLVRTFVTAAAAKSFEDRHPGVSVYFSSWFQPGKLIFAAVMLIPLVLGSLLMRITHRKRATLPFRLYASGIFWGFVLAIGSGLIMLTAIVQAFGINFHLNDVFG